MAEVQGFRGFRFDPTKTGPLDDVITPPFDVITPEMRHELLRRGPHNMVRLILPDKEDAGSKYEAAARHLNAWTAEGALRQDPEDSVYLLEQTFRALDGKEHIRRAILAAVTIPDAGEDIILGHERTFEGPFEDRLRLMIATSANLEAVFGLYNDPDRYHECLFDAIKHQPVDAQARTLDGVLQRLWCAPCSAELQSFFREKTIYIADGHHRFRAAAAYRDRMRAAQRAQGFHPYDAVLMGLVAFEDPGFLICPTHRLLDPPDGFRADVFLSQLARWFTVRRVERELWKQVQAGPGTTIGVAIHGEGSYILEFPEENRVALLGNDHSAVWRDLDVAVLHRGILERLLRLPEGVQLSYEHHADAVLQAIECGHKKMAFLMKPVRPDQLRACAEAHDPMPQKSTYIFPKIPSGAVIRRLVAAQERL